MHRYKSGNSFFDYNLLKQLLIHRFVKESTVCHDKNIHTQL